MFRSQEQKNFSSIITAHIQVHDTPLLLEGGTGLGKTRAYLFALVEAAKKGKKIAIVLPTHQLIDQLLGSSDLIATKGEVVIDSFRPQSMFETRQSYELNKEVALGAQIMICTMASVIIDQRLNGEYNGVIHRDYILFDEADQLPDMTALQSDFQITIEDLKALDIKVSSAIEALNKILGKPNRVVEPEIKAAAKVILEAIEEPAWYQKGGYDDEGNIVLTHKLPGRLLKKISNQRYVAFISATLSVNESFDDFQFAMGIKDRSILSDFIEPEKHGELIFNIQPFDIDKDKSEWLIATIKTINEAPKPCLVITTSHESSLSLGSSIPQATVRISGETTTESAKRMTNEILIAAGAWAGLDTPIQWASVVIPRVPFGQPNVIEGEIFTKYLDARNTAVRRLRQAIGRGIRRPDSQCTIFILDGRVKKLPNFIPKRFQSSWNSQTFTEGNRVEITYSKAERDPSVRKAALKHYGNQCMSCNYLPKVISQLDVHHINPISEGERKTTLYDLVVLCANCHRLAHSTNPPLALESLRSLVNQETTD